MPIVSQSGLPGAAGVRTVFALALILIACSRSADTTEAVAGLAAVESDGASVAALAAGGPHLPASSPQTADPRNEPSPAPPLEIELPAAFVPASPATTARDVLALQTAATTKSGVAAAADGRRVQVSLTNLAPSISAWYVLRLEGEAQSALGLKRGDFHLQVRDRGTRLALFSQGLLIGSGSRESRCALWGADSRALAIAADVESAYVQLCDGALYVRNPVEGHRTSKEWVADFLRDRVPGGEQVTTFVKEELMQDAFLRTAEFERDAAVEHDRPAGAPMAPRLSAQAAGSLFAPRDLELRARTQDPQKRLLVGVWYAVEEGPGIYVGGLQPNHVAPEVVREQGDAVSPLDDVEARALTYMVAFDLSRFNLDFALGTDHPRVGWSERAIPAVVNSRVPGPDGFGSVAPLVRSGRIAPHRAPAVAATFIGGFKRSHGAFKFGQLAQVNRGSHYGFMEEGTLFSSLQPGLATAIVWKDGTVELKTWEASDDARLGEIRHARQNGVPIIERDPETGLGRAGKFVRKWGDGNWSGSQDQKFRTLRAGLCTQESAAGKFLIYGYFSSVTTSAMARVFQAYGCDYAMLLDMNALEHTYLAVYQTKDGKREVHHLDRGMEVLDMSYQGEVVPRFLAYPDNRDFFYLSRRSQ